MLPPAFEPGHDEPSGEHQADRWRGVHPAPQDAPTVGPPLVADDFLFFVVDERTGRLMAAPRVAGLGCAAALLWELVLVGSLGVQGGQLLLTQHAPRPDHRGAVEVWQEITANRQHVSTRTWLEFFASTALNRVASRMADAGLVRVESRRALTGRRVPAYVPANRTVSGWPAVRVERMLSGRDDRATPVDQALAALCDATGTIDRVLYDSATARQARARLAQVIAELHPYLRDLVATTKVAVGDAVLTRR